MTFQVAVDDRSARRSSTRWRTPSIVRDATAPRGFRRFLDTIDACVPAHLDVHVVLDNSSTHKTPSI